MKKREKIYLTIGLAAAGVLLLATTGSAATASSVANLSYLGQQGFPLGMRRNNPGNIVRGVNYQGEIFFDGGRFAQFETWALGIRAMIKLLTKYIATGSSYPNPCVSTPQNTVRLIISQWAPPRSCGGDNDDDVVEKYISFVAQRVGVSSETRLSANQNTLRKLVRAMAYYEQGRECVTDQEFNFAYTLV